MSKIPLITPLIGTIQGFINKLESKNFTELPQDLKESLSSYLSQGEEISLTLRNYRAIYKAPKWIDSNTYFNSWFILTDQRILILRNSSSFKLFRDIPLDEVSRTLYEMDGSDPRLTIITPGKEDRIEFVSEVIRHCDDIGKKLNEALEKNRQYYNTTPEKDTLHCFNCGTRIPKKSNFCPECGKSLKT
ncbi:MAG TPA: zinc-ribbon domain-containing protein [Thermodesulfobacteriota bacterium]